MRHVVFSDFDGTITAKDTIDAMYDAFGAENWPAVAKDLYSQGLRSRQIIKRMIGMVDATHEEIVAHDIAASPGKPAAGPFCEGFGGRAGPGREVHDCPPSTVRYIPLLVATHSVAKLVGAEQMAIACISLPATSFACASQWLPPSSLRYSPT